MTKTPKIGRPKLPKEEKKQVFPIRLSDLERRSIEAAATAVGQKTGEWARNTMLRAAGIPKEK
jgi:hypothetical protein